MHDQGEGAAAQDTECHVPDMDKISDVAIPTAATTEQLATLAAAIASLTQEDQARLADMLSDEESGEA